MKSSTLSKTIAVATLAVATVAIAQSDGGFYDPTGSSYDVPYQVQVGTTEFCVHAVTGTTTIVAVDTNKNGTIEQADALGCTKTFTADGVARNVLKISITPALQANLKIAGRSYSTGLPASVLSNWKELRAVTGAPVLLN